MNHLSLSAKACVMEPHILLEEEEERQREEEQEQLEEEEESEIPEEETGVAGYCSWSLSSLERALYLSLPGWVRAALLCNLMAQIGLVVGFHDTFPARLISYLLLPYTLPLCIFFDFTYRLLLRLKHIPEYIYWLWQDMKQIVLCVTKITLSSLKKYLADRFLPSFHLTPEQEFPSEGNVPTNSSLVRRRSTLRVQFSSMGSSSSCSTDSQHDPEARAFSFLMDLGLEFDSHPEAQSLPPCLPSSEGDDENSSTLTTCQIPARAGAE